MLTRRAAAIETLGAATVLCTDKTGTLTENRMTIVELRLPDGNVFAPASVARRCRRSSRLSEFGVLASAPEPFDPMERAFHTLRAPADRGRVSASALEAGAHDYGLRPDLLAVTHVWQTDGDGFVVAAKGAPEAIAGLCRLNAAERAADGDLSTRWPPQACVCWAWRGPTHAGPPWPTTPRESVSSSWAWSASPIPLRAERRRGGRECRSAGHPRGHDHRRLSRDRQRDRATGRASTRRGRDRRRHRELTRRPGRRVETAGVFARIMPEQKLRIVSAYKGNGEVVAMTGDGVNDAPSLKAAHIGIAMGGRGTDVAREASALVLLDDDFGSIVKAIRLGRRIYDNLRKAMSYIFAVHVPSRAWRCCRWCSACPCCSGRSISRSSRW